MALKDVIHIAIPVGDEQYRRYAEVTAASARTGSSLPVEIHFIDWTMIDRNRLERLGSWHGSAIAFSRLFLAELFPNLDWVISCDADILFRGDISELWKQRDDSVSIIASRDRPLPGHPYAEPHINWYREHGLQFDDPFGYFCDGLCLCNLKKWRETGIQDRFLEMAEKYSDWPSPDQMIVNYVLQHDKKLLSREWGVFSGDENCEIDWTKPMAIHYVEDAPWRRHKITHLISDVVLLWWRRAEQLGVDVGTKGYRGCRNRMDYALRRFLWRALSAINPLMKKLPRLWIHFRNTRRHSELKRVAIFEMHPAPYREPVLSRIAAMSSLDVDVVSNLSVDPGHVWAGLGRHQMSLYRGNGFAALVRTLWQFVISSRYDFVCWSAYYPYWLTIPQFICALLGKCYAVALDTTTEDGGRFSKFVKRLIFSRARFLWVPGLATRRFLEKNYHIPSGRIVEGVYAVESGWWKSTGATAAKGDAITFLSVCNNLPHRRIEEVVKGFAAFSIARNDVRLVLCGKGMSAFAGVPNIECIDGLPWDELPRLYAQSDVYVHNGNEQFSTTVQMAGLMGKPVIIGREVGIAQDLFLDGDCLPGLCVDKWQDSDAWCAAFGRMMELRSDWGAMGMNGRMVCMTFDVDGISQTVAARISAVCECKEANGMLVVDQLLRKHGVIREDEVWVHGMWMPDKWRKCVDAWIKGKKLVRMTHGSLSPIYLEKQGKWKKKLVTPIERWLFKRTDRVVVTCEAEKKWCQQWGLKNEFEILDLKKYFNLGVGSRPRRTADGSIHVLYLGRRHPLKGVEFLERAVEELNQSFEHSEHSNNRTLELRIVSDHFGEELEKDWNWCDVLVLPTLSENFGLVVAEALERGKKVITTDGAPAWGEGELFDCSECSNVRMGHGGRLVYLKGYRNGTDAERVELLKEAIGTLV